MASMTVILEIDRSQLDTALVDAEKLEAVLLRIKGHLQELPVIESPSLLAEVHEQLFVLKEEVQKMKVLANSFRLDREISSRPIQL